MGLFGKKNKDTDQNISIKKTKDQKKQLKLNQKQESIKNSQYIMQAYNKSTLSFGGSYAYNSSTNNITIPKIVNFKQYYDEINLNDVISFDVTNNGEVSEKFKIGLGVTGGLVLGPLGMLGALMKKKSSTISELIVRLYTKDGMYKVPFIQRKMNPKEATERLQAAETLTNLIKTNISSRNRVDNSIPTPASNISIADEIKKLSELKDKGILTQEEFDNQKQKLLNK